MKLTVTLSLEGEIKPPEAPKPVPLSVIKDSSVALSCDLEKFKAFFTEHSHDVFDVLKEELFTACATAVEDIHKKAIADAAKAKEEAEKAKAAAEKAKAEAAKKDDKIAPKK